MKIKGLVYGFFPVEVDEDTIECDIIEDDWRWKYFEWLFFIILFVSILFGAASFPVKVKKSVILDKKNE